VSQYPFLISVNSSSTPIQHTTANLANANSRVRNFDPRGPAGPTAFWKISNKNQSSTNSDDDEDDDLYADADDLDGDYGSGEDGEDEDGEEEDGEEEDGEEDGGGDENEDEDEDEEVDDVTLFIGFMPGS